MLLLALRLSFSSLRSAGVLAAWLIVLECVVLSLPCCCIVSCHPCISLRPVPVDTQCTRLNKVPRTTADGECKPCTDLKHVFPFIFPTLLKAVLVLLHGAAHRSNTKTPAHTGNQTAHRRASSLLVYAGCSRARTPQLFQESFPSHTVPVRNPKYTNLPHFVRKNTAKKRSDHTDTAMLIERNYQRMPYTTPNTITYRMHRFTQCRLVYIHLAHVRSAKGRQPS
jgi:hypothetical protein